MKSKTWATWLALAGGGFGLHRFYLNGGADAWGWLHLPFTLLGLWGAQRMDTLGQDDRLAWLLLPLLGLSLSVAMLSAIVYGLTADEQWDVRHNAGARSRRGGWPAVIGVVLALAVGSTVLISTIAFGVQHIVELLLESNHPN